MHKNRLTARFQLVEFIYSVKDYNNNKYQTLRVFTLGLFGYIKWSKISFLPNLFKFRAASNRVSLILFFTINNKFVI